MVAEKFTSYDILVVEDNPNDVELLLRAFSKNNLANRINVVEDGEQALDYLFSVCNCKHHDNIDPPKVVLLDLKLPKISGLEVLKEMKWEASTRMIPVVIVTTSDEEPDIRKAYDLGVNSYVVKPVDFEQFIKVMNSLGFYWMMVNKVPGSR
jgi:two-component system response regulator